MDKLRVRFYGVRFGDAILISFTETTDEGEPLDRNILIDVGNSNSALLGGKDNVFEDVFEDIHKELKGKPVDLYILTHEHLDHAQGLYYASVYHTPVEADYVWITASAAADYKIKFPNAERVKLECEASFRAIYEHLHAGEEVPEQWLENILAINNPRATDDCVDYIQELANEKTTYVHRETDLEGTHPFNEVKFTIWAPEEDTFIYYSGTRSLALGTDNPIEPKPGAKEPDLKPPPGVDAGAFYNLVDIRKRGYLSGLMTINKARNNTSVVFTLEWHGNVLLFTGDVEEESYETMFGLEKKVMKEVDFIKVSHHGSKTGIPSDEIFKEFLPKINDPSRKTAVVTTYHDTHPGVPARKMIEKAYKGRCELVWIDEKTMKDGRHKDFTFSKKI